MIWLFLHFASLILLFSGYLAVMNVKRAKDSGKLSKTASILAFPTYAFSLTVDIWHNWTTCWVLGVPRELTMSARLTKLLPDAGWRGKFARWICADLLDPFDPSGCHCR